MSKCLNNEIKTLESFHHVDKSILDAEILPSVENDSVFSSSDPQVVLHDHSYHMLTAENVENQQDPGKDENEDSEKVKCVCVSVGCQSDFTMRDIGEMEKQINKTEDLEKENANLKYRLSDKAKLIREYFMDDVLKNDESIKFYTGILTLRCFNMLTNLIKPVSENLKYWDKNKGKKMKFQDLPIDKSGPKTTLHTTEEFVLCLVRLRLGLMGRRLADIFSVSNSQISRIFTTWVCFLALVFKEMLVLWPSQDAVKANLPCTFDKYPHTKNSHRLYRSIY